ncbi:zinc-binding dehydrogenase [Ilumatobacter coccineus]|uniref:Putative zinc-containing alcohol dehydrogenase n=1 Tax=Ilumatobacter coccineus (strain NBRC 103263 / KCTC 29153 / YM16-304) TaxID=1313172 RepID=A0A6C7EAT2_ILUCY|nr:alcohol dehydrogenase catalytic domain-containing protein [Ilumatobacter coccineus]BAN03581.1 putative zinc-containing alcohol dehydrogenase [Ilumatobacter coccineus YM16-304]
MNALVFNGPRDIRYEDYADPELTVDNGVIVKVQMCSICGSDLHIYHGDAIGSVDYTTGLDPFCVGHEFIGEVVEAGPMVYNSAVGDRVFVAGGTGCGSCGACRSGIGKCPATTAFGCSTRLQGGQAEFVQVPNADRTIRTIPDHLGDEQALLLTDAMATAKFGIDRCEITPGDTVAVVGLGPIGLLGVELAHLSGAAQVIAIDPVAGRRDHAAGLGASALPPGDDLVAAIRQLTGGRLVDRCFEASGAAAAIASVPRLMRSGGTASFIGLPQGGTGLDMAQLIYRNLTVRAGVAPVPQLWPSLLPLLESGRLRAEGLFSHRMPLSAGAEGYRLFDSRDDGVLKILFEL